MVRLCEIGCLPASTTIALVDGQPDLTHASLASASISVISVRGRGAASASAAAASHATFVASTLVGAAPDCLGLCEGCRVAVVAAVDQAMLAHDADPVREARRLADAILSAAAHNPSVIQLSLELGFASPRAAGIVEDALRSCHSKGIALVMAAGEGRLRAMNDLFAVPGVIPVTAARETSEAPYDERWGAAMAHRGLAAPGARIPGAQLPSGISLRSGSSYAASFVSAAIVRLMAAIPGLTPVRAANALALPRDRGLSAAAPQELDADRSLRVLEMQRGGSNGNGIHARP
jgi:hypothetical protein